MGRIPPFEEPFLEEIAFGLRKRQKALRHHARSFEADKVYELRDGERHEKLEAELDCFNQVVLRMQVWPDRWFWLDARRGSKQGWIWEWTYDGRLVGSATAVDVVAALKASVNPAMNMEADRTAELATIWKPLLARGPTRVA